MKITLQKKYLQLICHRNALIKDVAQICSLPSSPSSSFCGTSAAPDLEWKLKACRSGKVMASSRLSPAVRSVDASRRTRQVSTMGQVNTGMLFWRGKKHLCSACLGRHLDSRQYNPDLHGHVGPEAELHAHGRGRPHGPQRGRVRAQREEHSREGGEGQQRVVPPQPRVHLRKGGLGQKGQAWI